MGFYDNATKTAQNLLKKFGQPLTFTHVEKGAFDPVTGSYSGNVTTTHTVNGARFDYNAREIDGTTILMGDCRVYLEAKGYAPQVKDTCVIDGKTWRVQNPRPLSPAGSNVMFDLNLRG